jgi:glutamate racemase
VVIACNTASALALDGLETTVPTWGVIGPGAQAAAAVSRGRVGVIATESTVRSGAYPRALARLRPELEVLSQACPLFVPLVEEGWSDDPVTEVIARRYLAPLLAAEIDTLVLGCTHYPLLKPTLQRIVGDVLLVDSAETIAEVVATQLGEGGLAHPPGGVRPAGVPPRHHLCVTDDCDRVERLAAEILAHPVSLEWVEV